MEKLIYGWIYKHYKSETKLYEVIWESIHTETGEELVIYKALYLIEWYPEWQLWVRPKDMFLWDEEYNWETVKRFTLVDE